MAFLDYSGLQRFKSKLDALFNGKLNTSLKGAANGLAELDSAGKVPSAQLPSFVDDVLEYASLDDFPLTGESGKIYIALDTNKTYRWSGSAYVEISSSLALGETSSTAYRGDRGKAAYDHAAAKGSAFTSGLYKITTNAQGHVTAATAVAKSDITGLGIPGSDTNTHRPIQVNGTEILGNNTTALNLKAGSNVSVTNSSGTVTISATDTTYSSKTASSGGTDVSLVTTGEKYTWNNKASSDTKNTAGTTNKTGTKMFIAAATSQGDNPQTYSNANVYIGTDNCLYSNGTKVLTAHQDISGKKNTQSAVSDPTTSGTSVTFIDTISQNEQGVITPTKKTVQTMGAASSSAAGTTGLVPAPAAGNQSKFLRGDGTWNTPTNTKNTAGATDSSSKLFLIGATAQGASPQTYSHDTAYVGTDGCLYSGGDKVLTSHQDISGKKNTQSAVSDPSAAGTSLTFISGIRQDEQGVISAGKKTVATMRGASSSAAGSIGLVPKPYAGQHQLFLKGDGTWSEPDGVRLYVADLDTVTNTSGSYTHTSTVTGMTSDLKAVLLECSNPEIFMDKVIVTTGSGTVTLACADVAGTSTVKVSFAVQGNANPLNSTEYAALDARIGDLSDLTTLDKSSVVGAVNSLNSNFVKVWENSNVSASFSPQTISLDLSAYRFVFIVTSDGTGFAEINYDRPFTILGNMPSALRGRGFKATSTGVVVNEGKNNDGGIDNTNCIPYRIYGIK